MAIDKDYIINLYDNVKDDIIEIKKKLVSLFKAKLEEKGFKFYVEMINKNPLTMELNHVFITKHLESNKWVLIDCKSVDSILFNRKTYKTFHTIDIRKVPKDFEKYAIHYGYILNKNNELQNINKDEYDELISTTHSYSRYSGHYFGEEDLKSKYYIRDFTRKHKIDKFFENL